jgi:hypothetical protein
MELFQPVSPESHGIVPRPELQVRPTTGRFSLLAGLVARSSARTVGGGARADPGRRVQRGTG